MVNFVDKIFGRLGNRMFQSAYIYSQFKKGLIPDIYLQDEKWFKEFGDDIKQIFKQHGEMLNYIAVHIRRGKNISNPDEPAYCDNPFYVNLWKNGYYEKAMNLFDKEEFLIFSDDIDWCKDNLKGNLKFSENGEMEDFNLMTRCKHNIIANSSFSWWAAYLNPNPNKIIIAPKQWYSDGVERTKCPKEWRLL